jgi:hypothetical protein
MSNTPVNRSPTPPTPPRSIWQRHSDREAKQNVAFNTYNQGVDVFVRTPSPDGPGSPKSGYKLVAELIRAVDKAAGVNR